MKNNSRRVLIWSITVALAGFLFGFDTVVISGADLSLQELWPRGDVFHGFVIMASALWGTVIGAVFGGLPTDKIGRKKTLFWIGILYTISAIGSALASDPFIFAAFRLIGGLGVGASTIAAPAYVAEIAPAKDRGKLVALYQFNIVFGILVAFISNYLLSNIETDAWRWMIGVEAIPAIIYTLMVLTIPKSPRWLIFKKNDIEGARRTLNLIDPDMNIDHAINQIKEDGQKKHSRRIHIHEKIQVATYTGIFNSFFQPVLRDQCVFILCTKNFRGSRIRIKFSPIEQYRDRIDQFDFYTHRHCID